MSDSAQPTTAFRVADLHSSRSTRFSLQPDSASLKQIAQELDLLELRKLRFEGDIRAEGKRDWRLEGTLGATVVQTCVITLAPVVTRLDVPVLRRFLAELTPIDDSEEEIEMPDDETIEALGSYIDPAVVMTESLALALPPYPRAEGANLDQTTFTEPGKQAMQDEDTLPFAGLAALRDKLDDKDTE